jgi:hypothetical protein
MAVMRVVAGVVMMMVVMMGMMMVVARSLGSRPGGLPSCASREEDPDPGRAEGAP